MKRLVHLFIIIGILTCLPSLPLANNVDVITLKDGSVIHGEVVEMSSGELHVKTSFGVGDIVRIKWANVAKLTVNRSLPFHLKEGKVIMAAAEEGPNGTLLLKAEPLGVSLTVPIDSITSINPLVQPPVLFQGAFTAGLSGQSGNTKLRNGSLLLDLTGRSEKLRLTMVGRYVYGENAGQVISRNSRGTIKLDFFLTKRFYWFAAVYFEQDTFQDLKLRTAISSGPGYQFIDKGDFDSPYLEDMTLNAEYSPSYFNEEFKIAGDQVSTRGRFSAKWNWPIFDDRIVIYHFDEVFHSYEDSKDYYFTSDQGIRLKIFEGFVAGFQLTYRYNNKPPPGIMSSDTLYLFTLGYGFDTTAKR